MDYLLKEDNEETANVLALAEQGEPPLQSTYSTKRTAGMIICAAGVLGLIVWGVLFIMNPTVSEQLSESSVITVDGNGFFLILCILAVTVGMVLFLKNWGKNERR